MTNLEPLMLHADGEPSDVEQMKITSRYLRGTIAEGLADQITGAISAQDNRLMKFHGSYMQDDRDLRYEREQQRLEPAYQFMVRMRIAGGIISPTQWLKIDQISRTYANHTIRITTRQTLQLHGILKWHLKPSFQQMHDVLLTTIAACGDVNRNVMCSPTPYASAVHEAIYAHAALLSHALNPRSKAYHEIFLDGEKIDQCSTAEEFTAEEEPLYGPYYLPRKFKIGFCVPPTNDVDIYSQDLGFIAIEEDGQLIGYNVVVGGGMGMTYSDAQTYPQLARTIGFCTPDQVVAIAEQTITIQRDYGNRAERKYARMKYTIDRRGLAWFTTELHRRLGWSLASERPISFAHNGDRYGWIEGTDGHWHLTIFMENGRIRDAGEALWMTGLREIAKVHTGDFRLTPNQNIIVGNVQKKHKSRIMKLVNQYGLLVGDTQSAIRKHAIACVALPTCGLAMAESERYMPTFLTKIEQLLAEVGLPQTPIVIRMTGCPNGCARPFLAEIALTGRAVGKYNLYLGGDFAGRRLNALYREQVSEADVLALLRPLFQQYATQRQEGEYFGDFVVRMGVVKAVTDGRQFHA